MEGVSASAGEAGPAAKPRRKPHQVPRCHGRSGVVCLWLGQECAPHLEGGRARRGYVATATGTQTVRLSREKINHISQLIIKELAKNDAVRFLREPNEVRLEIVKLITDQLSIDDEIDRQVRTTLDSYTRKVVEGSREWDIMYSKLYDEEFNKRRRF